MCPRPAPAIDLHSLPFFQRGNHFRPKLQPTLEHRDLGTRSKISPHAPSRGWLSKWKAVLHVVSITVSATTAGLEPSFGESFSLCLRFFICKLGIIPISLCATRMKYINTRKASRTAPGIELAMDKCSFLVSVVLYL